LSVCRQLRDVFCGGLDGFFGHGLGFMFCNTFVYFVLTIYS
jgi:hypothetical protein